MNSLEQRCRIRLVEAKMGYLDRKSPLKECIWTHLVVPRADNRLFLSQSAALPSVPPHVCESSTATLSLAQAGFL